MRDRSSSGVGDPADDWVRAEMRQVFDGASILVVEDDADIRELLVTMFELAGYSVTPCASAEQGLDALREATFDFVLTDYALPNRTGAWLLQQAEEEGLLEATPALVVTAHPTPPELDGFEIVRKPFDLDDLIANVRRRLAGGVTRRREAPDPRRRTSAGRPGDGSKGDCPDPIELILYVSAESARSATAIDNIKRILARYRSDKVTLTICDLAKNPSLGTADSIAFTPTLVKRSPGPRTFILGHLTNPDVLVELLDGCDIAS